MGKLYIVGPLMGHSRDAPLRVLRILREASLIVSWDETFAQALLREHDIRTPLCKLGERAQDVIQAAVESAAVQRVLKPRPKIVRASSGVARGRPSSPARRATRATSCSLVASSPLR